jgi:hypothetical protein
LTIAAGVLALTHPGRQSPPCRVVVSFECLGDPVVNAIVTDAFDEAVSLE